MKRTPSILFVSHSASRNGATLLLLESLKWLRAHTDFKLKVLMCGNGELVRDFRAVCDTRVWHNPSTLLQGLPERWREACRRCIPSGLLKSYLGRQHCDLVYFNTSAVAAYVPLLAGYADSSVWHIHELDYVLRLNLGHQRMERLSSTTTRFISVSQAVTDTLTRHFQIPAEKIDLVHGFVPLPQLSYDERWNVRNRVRGQLGLPPSAFVVGGCGSLGWRKGTDIFLQIARSCCSAGPSGDAFRFIWVGGGRDRDEILRFEHDVRAFGLNDRCQLIPDTAAVTKYYLAMDAFALTSREDPFPLVMLEAGTCHLPTICFHGTGGAPEFVNDGCGLAAPYGDLQAFAGHLLRLQQNPEERVTLGIRAAEKVARRHGIASQGPRILAVIEKCLSMRNASDTAASARLTALSTR